MIKQIKNVIIIADSAQRNGGNAMAHRQYANQSSIKNLTHTSYEVYSTNGGYIELEPTIYNESDPEDTLYIVNTGSRDYLVEHGIDIKRLFFASCQGCRQDGKLIWALYPYKVDEPKLVPHREF